MADTNQDIANAALEAQPVEPAIQEMIDAGVFYGRTKTKTHPRMRRYIAATRNLVEIIDLEDTQRMLDRAMEFLREKVKGGASVLLVGTQPAAKDKTLAVANEFGYPTVVNRWLGGTITNFKVIHARIEYFKKLKADFAAGVFHKYTKKEQLMIEREIERLTELFGTLEGYSRLPDVVVVTDTALHATAVREAKVAKIPVIAFVNTDADPELVSYPVLGNNKARGSVEWFLTHISSAISEGRREAVKPVPEPQGEETK